MEVIMKRLILMRHAKADDHFSGSDLSRPLTQEGKEIQKEVSKFSISDLNFFSKFIEEFSKDMPC